MKIFLIFWFACKALTFPIIEDRIIFPDEYKKLSSDSVDEFKTNQLYLLNDSNILASDNMTLEFLFDEKGFKSLEDGEHFQGDMMLLEEQLNTLNDTSDMSGRTGIIGDKYRWPKNNGGKVIVPYEISDQFGEFVAHFKIHIIDILKNSEFVTV